MGAAFLAGAAFFARTAAFFAFPTDVFFAAADLDPDAEADFEPAPFFFVAAADFFLPPDDVFLAPVEAFDVLFLADAAPEATAILLAAASPAPATADARTSDATFFAPAITFDTVVFLLFVAICVFYCGRNAAWSKLLSVVRLRRLRLVICLYQYITGKAGCQVKGISESNLRPVISYV